MVKIMKKKLIITLVLLTLLVAYLLLGSYFHIYMFCPIKKITGLYCPGCGVTRMCLSILKGNFYQAFRYNPLIFISLPFFLFYYFICLFETYKKKPSKIRMLEPSIWYFLIAIFLVFGILRNIPFFDFLKPTVV